MTVVENKKAESVFGYLLLLALCVDLFTPYLIWKQVLPAQIRWISHAMLAATIALSFARMLAFNQIPRAAWLILATVLLWSYVAIGHRQGLSSTIWGIWLLVQFPFVCLFVYLQPDIWDGFPSAFRKYGLILLAIQSCVQLVQYASGVAPGDSLSGLFGQNGTGNAVMFAILVCCAYFGHWITTKKWRGLLAALALATVSSVLGEMKLFPVAIGLIGVLATVVYVVKNRAPGRLFAAGGLVAITLVAFLAFYNAVIPDAYQTPLQTFITNPAKLTQYVDRSRQYYVNGQLVTDMGRNFAIQVGWEALNNDPITWLFGYGIGSRSESRTLGTAGVGLTSGNLGLSTGTSLLVMMQELGFVGLTLLGVVFIWMAVSLARDLRKYTDSPSNYLRYALLFFTILWPLWLWYSSVWTMRVPMLLYWFCMGYVLAEARILQANRRALEHLPVGE